MDALILETRTPRKVPVPSHPAVDSVFERPTLGAVTLRTESHGFYHGQLFSGGEMKT